MLSHRAQRTLDHLCRTWEVAPIGYIDTSLGRIYLAEAWQARRPNRDGSNEGPGYTILWAVLHRGCNVARALYVKGDAEGRRSLAIADATQFLENYHRGKKEIPAHQAAGLAHA